MKAYLSVHDHGKRNKGPNYRVGFLLCKRLVCLVVTVCNKHEGCCISADGGTVTKKIMFPTDLTNCQLLDMQLQSQTKHNKQIQNKKIKTNMVYTWSLLIPNTNLFMRSRTANFKVTWGGKKIYRLSHAKGLVAWQASRCSCCLVASASTKKEMALSARSRRAAVLKRFRVL